MPDGQEKSDDLIAELAKLMASNAGSSEPEANPVPRLVTVPDAKPQGGAPVVRIPGMDTPVPSAAPAGPVSPVAQQPAPQPVPAGVVRIPGMDTPVQVKTPEPAAAAPAPAPAPAVEAEASPAPEVRPAASFDFGPMPTAATTYKPEPLSNWQDREIPKPVPARSAPVEIPSPTADADIKPPVAQSAAPSTPSAEAPKPPADDAFDFDFGFATKPPGPIPAAASQPAATAQPAPIPQPKPAPQPQVAEPQPAAQAQPAPQQRPAPQVQRPVPQAPTTAAPRPVPQGVAQTRPAPQQRPAPAPAASVDPIADLIAAELDAAEPSRVEPVAPPMQAPRQAAPQPAARSHPSNVPQSQPQQRPMQQPPRQAAAQSQPQPQSRGDDRFAVAPVFGPSARAATSSRPQPPADPMDEIESLIGEAVRVELKNDAPTPAPSAPVPPPAQAQAPVVPPLNTGFAPRRATIKDTEQQVPSAEAAILAAAAATGAEVGRLDSVTAEPSPYKRPKVKPDRRRASSGGMRQYVGMAVAGTLLLAAGFGLYWVLGMGRGNDADAPVLTADATPVKETPPAAPASTNQQTGSVVFGNLDGSETPAADEQLVSRDDSDATSVADVATPVGGEPSATTADAAGSESELANRKVRTVTVRPDGTIVSGDDAVAGNETLPVDRPVVPDLPGADVQPSELLAAVPDAATANADPLVSSLVDPNATTDANALIDTGPAPEIDPTKVAPIPVARPSDRTRLAGGANYVAPAAAEPAPVNLVADSNSAPITTGGGSYVQLSSQPTQGDARASLNAQQSRLSNLLAGRSLAIRQVDLGAKGTWYRVVLPVDSFSEATQTCASLKANGVDCVAIGG